MRIEFSDTKVKKVLNKSKIYGVDYCLNPYKGCQHACRYCYAELIIKKTGKREKWGTYVEIKENFPEFLKREVLRVKKGLVMVSSITDPYQSIEGKALLTRKCLEILAEGEFPVYILTKSSLVLRDIDILKRFEDIEVGITITTDDEKIRKYFEPCAPSIEERTFALKRLKKEGLKTCAFIGPALPMNPERLLKMIEGSADYTYIDKLNYSFKVVNLYRSAGLMKYLEREYFEKVLEFFSSHYKNVINCMK
ncbi:MAG: radical SAM protein [Candidatus Aminicenantia bacterium]